jgi:hypothetical protein
VSEPDDARAGLAKAQIERQLLGVVSQRNESHIAVDVIAHENCQLAAGHEDAGTVGNQ